MPNPFIKKDAQRFMEIMSRPAGSSLSAEDVSVIDNELRRRQESAKARALYEQYQKEVADKVSKGEWKRPGEFGVSGFGGDRNKKFDVGEYLGGLGGRFLTGVASLGQTGVMAEDVAGMLGKNMLNQAGLSQPAKELAAGKMDDIVKNGLFHSLYYGNDKLGLSGVQKETQNYADIVEKNAEAISTGNTTADKVLRYGAKTAGDLTYGAGYATGMAVEGLAGGASAWPGVATSTDDLVSLGSRILERTGVLDTLSMHGSRLLSDPAYWTSFAGELGADYMEALDRGASEQDAMMYAIATSGLNSIIEVGGEVPGIQDPAEQSLWRVAKSEGIEEIEQGPVERAMQNAMLGADNPWFSLTDENAVFNPVTAAKEGAMGAAIGGMLGAGQRGIMNAQENAQIRNAYKEAYGPDSGALVEEALDINPENKTAQAAQKRLEQGGTLSGATIRKLVQQNEAQIQQQEKQQQTQEEAPVETDERAERAAAQRLTIPTTLEEAEADFGKAGAEAYMATKPSGIDTVRYYHAFNTAYQYGKAGANLANTYNALGNTIPSATTLAAWTAGREQVKFQAQPQQIKLDEKVFDNATRKVGTVTFDGVDRSTLNATQKASVKMLEGISKVTGLNIRVVQSRTDANGNYIDENGSFNPATNEITISVDAGLRSTEDLADVVMGKTASHELTHFVKKSAPESYKTLQNFVVNNLLEKGMSLNDLVQSKIDRSGGKLTYDEAVDEVVADACENMLKNTTAIDTLARENWSLFKQIRNWLRNFHNALKRAFAGKGFSHEEATALLDKAEEMQKLWDEAFVRAVQNYQQEESLVKAGIEVDQDSGSAAQFALRSTWTTEYEQEKAAKALAAQLDVPIEKARKWVQSETSLAAIVGSEAALDYVPDERYSMYKTNSDYPQGTIDASNLCRKRVPFTDLFTRLQKNFPDRVFTAQDMEAIRQIMIQHNETVACGLCYVEERRQHLGEIAKGFIDSLKDGTLKPKVAEALDKSDTYIPNQYDLITYEGLWKLTKEHPSIAEAFKIYNNARGMQAGRLIEGRAEYDRQILKWSDKKVKAVNDAGGLRIFSYSDFEVPHMLDIIQVIQDCATKGVKIQAYTKVPEFAALIKATGVKLNRSLIAKGTGVKYENGKLVLDLDPVEGIDINSPYFFDSTDNPDVGNILVGMSNEQIRLAMTSPFVDYIIPFHTSLPKTILEQKGISHWHNYKNAQTDKDLRTGKVADKQINIYTDVLQAAEEEGKPITNKVEFVEKFLQVAKERGLKPRFWEFLDVDADGNYVYTEGYHKFLVDFKLFDQNGNILPQNAVRPEFDDALVQQIAEEYVEGVKAKKGDDAIYDEAVKALGLEEGRAASVGRGENVRFSIREEAKDEVRRVLAGEEIRHNIIITDGTPSIMIGRPGVRDLPLAMKPSHVRENILTEDEAKKLGFPTGTDHHYHGLGESLFYEIIDNLNDIVEAYRGTKNAAKAERRENYFLLISKYKDSNQNTINVPVYINTKATNNELVMVDANTLATVFGREGLREYINRELSKKNLVRIKKRGTTTSERPALIADGYSGNTSTDSVAQPNSDVKTQMSVREKAPGEDTTIFIPDSKANGQTVSFTDLILDGEKKGETRGLNVHLPVGRWIGIAKNGQVVGRVILGEPKRITIDSPEYQDAYIEGTDYDIGPGEEKLYYPIVDKVDMRDDPKPVLRRSAGYGVYQTGNTDATQFSLRDPGEISDRDLLASALETVAQTPAEREILQRYQAKAAELTEIQRQLNEQKALMRDHIKGTHKLTQEELMKARNRAEIFARQLDRADKELLKLEGMAPVKQMLEREHKAYRKAVEAKDRAEAKLERYSEKMQGRIEAARQSMADYRKRRWDTEARRKYKGRIQRIRNSLYQSLTKPNDSLYVPTELLDSAYQIALMLDTSGEREDTKSKAKFSEQMRRLEDQYDALQQNKDSDYQLEYDPEFAQMMKLLRQKLNNKAIRDLTLTELEDVSGVLQEIDRLLKDAKYQIGRADKVTNYAVGESIARQQREYDIVHRGKAERIAAATMRVSANPMRNVRRMAQYNAEAELQRLFDGLNEGVREKNRFIMDSNKVFDDFAGKRMRKAATEIKTYELAGEKVQMTEMQAMQIILSWTREAVNGTTKHMTTGGVLIPDAKLMEKGKGAEAVRLGQQIRGIQEEDIQALYNSLDDWAKDYMDAASKWFNGMAQDFINDATMKTKHRQIATTPSYIPFETDPNTVAQEIEGVKFDGTIEGMGMLKSVQEGAANALIMRGLDTVIMRHIDKVSQMALAAPIKNYNKAMASKLIGEGRTAKSALQSDDAKMLDQVISDLQTTRTRDRNMVSDAMDKLQKAFVRATLLSNISVTIKQAASYSTAGLYLSQAALAPYQAEIARLFANNNSEHAKRLFAEIDAHTAAHYMRRKGMSLQEAAMIAQDPSKLEVWMDENVKNDALNPIKWIQNMDVATTGALWLACKKQVELDGVAKTDENYWDKVTELYEKVIEETQPMYDALHRPELLRTTNSLIKQVFMFKTQPMQNAGVIWDAVGNYEAAKKSGQGVKEARAQLARAVGSQLASLAVFATMSFLAYAVKNRLGRYKDEEEELTVESVMKRILLDMGSSGAGLLMPLGGSELFSMTEGIVNKIKNGGTQYDTFSVPVVDMVNDWIKDTINLINDLSDLDENAEKVPQHLHAVAWDVSSMFGIPAENVYNLIRGGVGNVGDWTGNPVDWATDESNTIKGMNAAWNNGHYDLAKRKMNDLIKDKVDSGKTEKEAKSYIKQQMTTMLKPMYKVAVEKKNSEEQARIREIMIECGLYDNITKTLSDWLKD